MTNETEPKNPGHRLLMFQRRLDTFVAELERESFVLNVHYVPKGDPRTTQAPFHVTTIWPLAQWEQFYLEGGVERLVDDGAAREALAARAARKDLVRRLDAVDAALKDIRATLRSQETPRG